MVLKESGGRKKKSSFLALSNACAMSTIGLTIGSIWVTVAWSRLCVVSVSRCMTVMFCTIALSWVIICGVAVEIFVRPSTIGPKYCVVSSMLSSDSFSERMAQHIGMSKQCGSQYR
ncbi:Uncharacterised protein [Mycobacteroides abscessus subsp. abscessus]|nr:Uncharacterised protein [Mycobacteroides abscessus subsp. abscessus]